MSLINRLERLENKISPQVNKTIILINYFTNEKYSRIEIDGCSFEVEGTVKNFIDHKIKSIKKTVICIAVFLPNEELSDERK